MTSTLTMLCDFPDSGPQTSFLAGDLPKFHIPRVPSSPSISYSSGSPLASDELRSEFSQTRSSSLPPSGDFHKEENDLELESESTLSEDVEIPHFLVTSPDRPMRQQSRTREIVDRLRSAVVPRGRTKAPTTRVNGNLSTPTKNRRAGLNNTTVKQLFQKGNDGWIRLADESQANSSRDRTPTEDSELSDNEGVIFTAPAPKLARDWKKKQQTQSKHARRTSGSLDGSSTLAANAHSVTSGPPRRPHGHDHRLAQSVQLAAPASVGTFTFPPPAFYAFPGHPPPQYPPPPPAVTFGGLPPYHGYPPRGYHPAPVPFVGVLPYQHQHQQQLPHPHVHLHRATYMNATIITGSTGIRHAQW
ncbi:hypothetical protein B0F90DRAFT_198425 [Multifurca ochricompacta]|uniref:Uncharacterized protein n=1 Tax=Multifurca ochricompacta TaxID=376703 RepID=A0AAD4QP47_9AGAM|nr:hypothetical protein B0F90DRAFT_198425 [Multifurca ochricompacta]